MSVGDEALVRGLLDGDGEAVAQVRRWVRAAFVSYRSKMAEDLEDVEQEILIEVIETLKEGRFRGESSFKTYVRTCTHYKCIDRLRARGRRPRVDLDALDMPCNEPSAFDEMARSERIDLALRVVEQTPEGCRELWEMLRQGLRYGEMSRRLGVSEGTLRARVLRCRRKALELREKLAEKNSRKTS